MKRSQNRIRVSPWYMDIDTTVVHNVSQVKLEVTGTANATTTAWGFGRVAITVDALRTVLENSPINTTIGLPITGADADQNRRMKYMLDSSADAAPFWIGAHDGQLYVAKAVLDKEVKNVYNFKMRVTDEMDSSLYAEASVFVHILDTKSVTEEEDVPRSDSSWETSSGSVSFLEDFCMNATVCLWRQFNASRAPFSTTSSNCCTAKDKSFPGKFSMHSFFLAYTRGTAMAIVEVKVWFEFKLAWSSFW